MKRSLTRQLGAFLFLTCGASAQIVVQDHSTGALLASPLLFPDTPVNDFTERVIDVVNTGSASVTVNSAIVTGQYYSLCCESSFELDAGAKESLTLKFAPSAPGYGTGALQIAGAEPIFIFTHAIAAASLFLQTTAGVTEAFTGSPLEITLSAALSLPATLQNNSGVPVTVNAISATGNWTAQNLPSLPLTLQAGQTISFVVAAASGATTPSGTIQIDQWTYSLGGHPPSSNISIVPANSLVQSGQQSTVSIGFDPAPNSIVNGTLSINLEASGAGVALTDPAVLFPSTGTTTASFSSVPGQTTASFNGQNSITFQTGTTAGTIHLTAAWGYSQDAVDINIQPGAIGIDTVTAKRASNSLSITVTAFDNTRTAGRMSFSFLDKKGAFIGSPISADFTEAFQDYFQQTSDAGGMFKMLLNFPVSGGTSDISSVKLDLLNQAGDAQSNTTSFQ